MNNYELLRFNLQGLKNYLKLSDLESEIDDYDNEVDITIIGRNINIYMLCLDELDKNEYKIEIDRSWFKHEDFDNLLNMLEDELNN